MPDWVHEPAVILQAMLWTVIIIFLLPEIITFGKFLFKVATLAIMATPIAIGSLLLVILVRVAIFVDHNPADHWTRYFLFSVVIAAIMLPFAWGCQQLWRLWFRPSPCHN